jgi:hypothetical protein
MATLTVGPSQQFTTIEAAVQAAHSGDTIDVNAGTYNDDFLTIEQSLTLQAVGGEVVMTEDRSPDDGKAMITEGQPGISVTINGFDISGVAVGDQNGAAIRYEGGNLTLGQDYFHNNQEGLLAASDPNGTITINDSEFARNGDGSGQTHNIYVNNIATLTVENSFIADANTGHDIKSRADNTIIENNRITDVNGSASYEIDDPNGGNLTVTGNTIEKGTNAQNPYVIAYGEEGQSNPGTNVNISNNTIVDDFSSGSSAVILNRTGTAVQFGNNQVYGLSANQLVAGNGAGLVDAGSAVFLASRPSLDTSSLSFINPAGSGNSGGSSGASGSGSGNASGSGGSGSSSPPPSPPAALPLIDMATWQAEVLNDFLNYYAAHSTAVAANPSLLAAFFTEYSDPFTGSHGIPAAAAWGPFPAGS